MWFLPVCTVASEELELDGQRQVSCTRPVEDLLDYCTCCLSWPKPMITLTANQDLYWLQK